MDVAALAGVNSALSEVVVSKDYSLQVSLAGDVCHVLGRSGGSLQLAAGQAPAPARTSLRIDSMQTVQRLASGGRAAALPLLAAGKLKVEGDLSQLEELRKELSPHAARLQPLAEAFLSNGTPGEVIWVPDEAADCCMSETCGRPFTLFRRRHHCRSCGKIFCNDCAPLRGAPQPKRSCTRCWEKRSRPLPAAAPAQTSDLSEVLGKHIIYTYENGWQYEIYFKSAEMIHYRIHSGLVAGRWVTNREVCMTALGKGLVRINWQEPVGNIVTMVTSLEDRWLHSYFLMPKWITEDPMATVCHEDEHVEEMLKRREQGPTWPMHIAENAFATITFLEDVGTGRDDIIDCPPDKLPAGYASRKN